MYGVERMRMFRTAALVSGAFLLLVHAAAAQSASPSALVDGYERAWGHQDVDAALALLADNAVVTVQDPTTRSMTSHQQIREFLQNAGLRRAPSLTTARQVDTNTVVWSERIESPTLNANELTVQAVVEDGKIQSLVYRSGHLIRGAGSPADTATPESAAAVLAALLLFGCGLLSLAGVRSRVRSGSNLRGRLMADLRLWSASPKPSLGAPTLL
jgi:hypothetical protein